MKTALFKLSDFISVLLFSDNFKAVCVSYEISKGATTWLLSNFTTEPACAAVSQLMLADTKKDQR